MVAQEMFRFTSVWRELITLLQDQVAQKPRRFLTRTAEAVFSGANAVDVLLRHIQTNPLLFPDRHFARPNVAKLCQRFLDLRVFFPAKNPKPVFEDSHFAFYRFNADHDFIGSVPNKPTTRRLKRCNSETDLVTVPLEAEKSLTKQLSAISCRLRKSIRRRSSTTKAKLDSINEEGQTTAAAVQQRMTKFNSIQEVSESPKPPRKKNVRRSLQMKQCSASVRITRSNAFRGKSVTGAGRRASCGDSSMMNATIESEYGDNVSLLNSTVCSESVTRVPKRTLRSVAMEQRKRVKSIASFSMNMSLVL